MGIVVVREISPLGRILLAWAPEVSNHYHG